MKTDEVPQDTAQTYAGVRKLLYAVDDKGEYTGVHSAGWEVETYVTMAAVDELNRLSAEALKRAQSGQTSALEYHMYARRMDLATLSAASGIWAWRIKRHFQPAVFAKLNDTLIARYAETMGIPAEELRRVPAASDV